MTIAAESKALRFSIDQIPLNGMKIKMNESYKDLARDLREPIDDLMSIRYPAEIRLEVDVFRVGSKVDIRGGYETRLGGECDICGQPVELPIKGDITTFLMPEDQFSDHDRPGGKVTHKPEGEKTYSRHRSRTKAQQLTGTPEDRAFEGFGAFDGLSVDLRPLILESLVLNLPIQHHCPGECRAHSDSGSSQKLSSPLAAALEQKLSAQ